MRLESIPGQKRIRKLASSEKNNSTEPPFFALTTNSTAETKQNFSRTPEFSKKCRVRNLRNHSLLDQLARDEDKETES